MKEELKHEILTAYNEAKSGWEAWFSECKEDWKFKMTDQWSDEDKSVLASKGLPMLSINHIFKNINLLSGYQRQNRGEIRVFPIEGGDEMKSEVLNMVIKWILVDKSTNFVVSDGFKDSLIGGLGWLHPYMTYEDDPIDGDIVTKKVSPFDILPDPHFTERNLSDCDYIIRHKLVPKRKLANLYPKYKKEIMGMSGTPQYNKEFTQNAVVASDQGNHLRVIEYWYRVYEDVSMLVDTNDPHNMSVWDGGDDIEEFLAANPDYSVVKMNKPRIRLAVLVEESLLVYDDYSPYNLTKFPFIPIFGFYESSYADWKLKLHGLVRPLKDLQREKNKRRSQIMQAINTMPSSGWIMDRNAVDDKATLAQSAGAGRIIERNPGKQIEKIPPPDVPIALIQMEQLFDNDIQVVGNNPDMLGNVMEKNAPGITLQLRQKQGLTSIQEVFDSLSDSQKELGRRLVEMITKHFSVGKIKRIVGDDFYYTKRIKELQKQLKELQDQVPVVPDIPLQVTPEDEMAYGMSDPRTREIIEDQKFQEREMMQEAAVQKQMFQVQQQAMIINHKIQVLQAEEMAFWEDFEKTKNTSRYDVAIDEIVGSPTYRVSVLSFLAQMQQYGMPVPPKMILDFLDLPKGAKEEYLAFMQAQMQAQAQVEAAKQGVPPATQGAIQ